MLSGKQLGKLGKAMKRFLFFLFFVGLSAFGMWRFLGLMMLEPVEVPEGFRETVFHSSWGIVYEVGAYEFFENDVRRIINYTILNIEHVVMSAVSVLVIIIGTPAFIFGTVRELMMSTPQTTSLLEEVKYVQKDTTIPSCANDSFSPEVEEMSAEIKRLIMYNRWASKVVSEHNISFEKALNLVKTEHLLMEEAKAVRHGVAE